MPPAEDIHRHLIGAWRMMMGNREGLRLLDLTADGFWNSFFAIVVALPVMVVGWVPLANETFGPDSVLSQRFGYLLRLAVVDIGTWVLPIAGLAAVAGLVGIRDRFVPYVVATNWGSAIFAWFMLPASLLRLVFPDAMDAVISLSLVLFLVTVVLTWRLTDAALGKGPAIATGVVAGVLLASILSLFMLQDLLGVVVPQ